MNLLEGLLVCPFGRRRVHPVSDAHFLLYPREDLFPPYRLLLNDGRGEITVRGLLFDGVDCSATDASRMPGQGELGVLGDVFGPQLLPFRGPPCPAGRCVDLWVFNRSCASVELGATLLASPTPSVTPVEGPSSRADSKYWR